MAQGVQLGLLAPAGQGEFHLTNAGHAAVRKLIDTAYAAMTPLHPLPDAELERLLDLLRRVVEASLAAPEPPGKWCLRIARHYDPAGQAGMMPQLDQYLSDLVSYRDDAHLATWKPLGVTGQEWETLTHLWHGDIVTLDDLCARHCARRGYSCESYAAALQALIARGWCVEQDGAYRITEQGRRLRDDAEATTDRYFFAPWESLALAELEDLGRLLTQTRDALRPASL